MKTLAVAALCHIFFTTAFAAQSIRLGIGSSDGFTYTVGSDKIEGRIGFNSHFLDYDLDGNQDLKSNSFSGRAGFGLVTKLNDLYITPIIGLSIGYTSQGHGGGESGRGSKEYQSGYNLGLEFGIRNGNIGIGGSVSPFAYNFSRHRYEAYDLNENGEFEKGWKRSISETYSFGLNPGLFVGYWF